jgi:hypothetical protein
MFPHDLSLKGLHKLENCQGKIGSKAAILGLIQCMEYSDCRVRSAAEALYQVKLITRNKNKANFFQQKTCIMVIQHDLILGETAKKHTKVIAPHLPHLLTLIPTQSGGYAYRVIHAIQENCKYYNYDLTQIIQSMKLFFSYAHKDETLRDELAKHLSLLKREGIITTWHDRDITAGTDWASAIDNNLNTANIILLLVSADFLASDYCYNIEMQRALDRHQQGVARVIPIILRPCDWHSAPFGKLQALPIAHSAGATPVTSWDNQDEAFLAIAQGIRKAASELQQHKK